MRAAPATLEFIDIVERAFLSSAKSISTRLPYMSFGVAVFRPI
jgi:hypothetical protein